MFNFDFDILILTLFSQVDFNIYCQFIFIFILSKLSAFLLKIRLLCVNSCVLFPQNVLLLVYHALNLTTKMLLKELMLLRCSIAVSYNSEDVNESEYLCIY